MNLPNSSTASSLASLRARRLELLHDAAAALDQAQRSGRTWLDASESAMIADLRVLDTRIADGEADEARRGVNNPTLARIRKAGTTMPRYQVSEPAVYRKGDPRRSYVMDLVKTTLNMDSDGESRARLAGHAQDVATSADYAEHRDLSRVDGSGGYAVPPSWLMDQYVELARPGRAVANLVQRQPLPGGTDSINIPKMLTGTKTGIQTADNTAVVDVDLTDTFINAPVRTIAGQQGIAIQLIDHSPIAFDDLIFRDLFADLAMQTDLQTIGGTGTAGQVLGILATPNIKTIAASAVTIAGVYAAIANGIQTIHTARFMPPEVIVMHPVRWGWFLAQLDNNDRPLFLPAANMPQNAAGILSDVDSQQVVGQMHGLPVVTDPNLPVNLGTGNDEDPVLVMRSSDLVLWESGIRARVLPEVKAENLTVLVQTYGYLGFTAARYPASVCAISGLTAPVW